MASTLNKANGAEFVAIITMSDGSHFVECFLRGPPPAPGFPSEMQPVYNNTDLPSFPAMPMQQARNIAIEQARFHGYTETEIAWED
jgi:hypothetical protein